MSSRHDNDPMPISSPPALQDDELETLLAEPFAQVWRRDPEGGAAQTVRASLVQRLAASSAAEAPMVTRRRRSVPFEAIADGVRAQTLYSADAGRTLRPGEPLRVRLLELAPGAHWPAAGEARRHREFRVLAGRVALDGEAHSLRDYRVVPAGHPWPDLSAPDGALLFVRESSGVDDAPPASVRDAEAGWPEFAPGIRRRVLWRRGREAALLYHADAGASVPVHRHDHDEECLMLQGELFLDDVLLQNGDWQLAPAGTGHRITETDTGVVIYAHGDLDLQFIS